MDKQEVIAFNRADFNAFMEKIGGKPFVIDEKNKNLTDVPEYEWVPMTKQDFEQMFRGAKIKFKYAGDGKDGEKEVFVKFHKHDGTIRYRPAETKKPAAQ